MLDYARQRAMEILKIPRKAVLATSGPAGLQAGEFPCEAIDIDLYLLVPRTSDHLYNLEHDPSVNLLTPHWELKGKAQVISTDTADLNLNLLHTPDAAWCELVRVNPYRMQIPREDGWGYLETIEMKPAVALPASPDPKAS